MLNKLKYIMLRLLKHICVPSSYCPDSKVYCANMGPIWCRQDPGGPHIGPMNFVISVGLQNHTRFVHSEPFPCCSIEDTLALMCGGWSHIITLLAWVLRIIYRYRYIDNWYICRAILRKHFFDRATWINMDEEIPRNFVPHYSNQWGNNHNFRVATESN